MSATHKGNCPKCDTPFVVVELEHGYVVQVKGQVVTECPVCGYLLRIEDALPEARDV